jgi:hypothetical protein
VPSGSVPGSVRVIATAVAAAAGVSCGLVPLAFSSVVDDRRTETIAILVATLGAASLFAALIVALAGTISEREGGDRPRGPVIATTAAAAAAALTSMIHVSGPATLTVAAAAAAALVVGYCSPSARDRAEVAARRRLLADAVGTPPPRIPEPWLVLAARDTDREYTAAGVAAALSRGLAVAMLGAVGSVFLALLLGIVATSAPPRQVALAVTGLLVVMIASSVLGAAVRGALRRSRPVRARRRPAGLDHPRRHSGAVSFQHLPVGVESLTLDIAPGEHVGLLLPPGTPGQDVAAAAAHVDGLGPQHVVHHGVDGRCLGRDDVLRQVAVVVPDITLIAGTLRDNLAVGDGRADEKQLLYVADVWGLLSTGAPSLDMAIDARAWPPERLLRLAAARAALSRPAVIVLFDPFTATGSAPSLSDDALRALADGGTVIRVSNREEALSGADFVVRIAA